VNTLRVQKVAELEPENDGHVAFGSVIVRVSEWLAIVKG